MKRRHPAALLCSCLLLACSAGTLMAESAGDVDLSRALTVEECVQIAIEHNHSVAIARNNVSSSRSAASRAWAGMLPDVSANAYWDRLTQGPTQQLTLNERTGEIIVAQTESQAFVSYSMGLNASQSLFSWSAVQSLAQARASLAAATHSSRATENDTEYGVKAQFYNLVKAEKLLEVSDRRARYVLETMVKARLLRQEGRQKGARYLLF